jgi:hypothetical protein
VVIMKFASNFALMSVFFAKRSTFLERNFSTSSTFYEKVLNERKVIKSEKLIWKHDKKIFYRVFGNWKCKKNSCNKKWSSAYTWIDVEKWKEGLDIMNFDAQNDYVQQECKACSNKENKLLKCENLVRSESVAGEKLHRLDLCFKCKTGNYCSIYLKK